MAAGEREVPARGAELHGKEELFFHFASYPRRQGGAYGLRARSRQKRRRRITGAPLLAEIRRGPMTLAQIHEGKNIIMQ